MRGFMALTSVLIISAILLVVTVSASIPAFYARVNALEAEWAIESNFLAQSCAGVAMLRRITQPGYTGKEVVDVDGTPCDVGAVDGSGGVVHIEYHGAVTVLHF